MECISINDLLQFKVELVDNKGSFTPLSLVSFSCIELCDKKYAKKVAEKLNQHFPIGQYSHLKRIRPSQNNNMSDRVQLLLTTTCELVERIEKENNVSIDEQLDSVFVCEYLSKILQLDKALISGFFYCVAPLKAPTTKVQYNLYKDVKDNNHWPILFKPQKLLKTTVPLENVELDEEELNCLKKCVINQLKLVQFDGSKINLSNCKNSATILNLKQSDENWDGASLTVTDPPDNEPLFILDHSLMKLIDIVAEKQLHRTHKNTSKLFDKNQYLCTNFDVISLREPCLMCGMALLHSRIRRLFFVVPSECSGAFSDDRFALNHLSGLNHRFLVYRISFKLM